MGGLVTATLIVRDEAAVLPGCLESIQEVVDDVVVVDTGSLDDSPAIASRFGARVQHLPWTGSFAAARNAALDEADGEWILYIDADERLEPVGRQAVEALLEDAPEVAFRLLLRPFEGFTPYREYRLWRNDSRIRFEGVIHEKVVPSIHAVAAAEHRPVGTCDLLLNHTGYAGDQTSKHRRNLPLLRDQVKRDPENLFVWNHLAAVLDGLGAGNEAEELLIHAVAVARAKPFIDPDGVLPYASLIAHRQAQGDDVGDLLAEARTRYPGNWTLVWFEGRMLLSHGRFEEALLCFERLCDVDVSQLPDEGTAYDSRFFREYAQESRALCLFRLGRFHEAALAYGRAEALAPGTHAYKVKRQLAVARSRSTEMPRPA